MRRLRQSGWWYPWIFVTAMTVVIAVNIVMASYAIDTFPGLDTEDAYRKGLAYNETIAAARAQEERGWRADVRFAPRAGGNEEHLGDIIATIIDRDGQPVTGMTMAASLVRPTNAGSDVSEFPLQSRGHGEYGATVSVPLPGQWDARIVAHLGATHYQVTRRLFVP